MCIIVWDSICISIYPQSSYPFRSLVASAFVIVCDKDEKCRLNNILKASNTSMPVTLVLIKYKTVKWNQFFFVLFDPQTPFYFPAGWSSAITMPILYCIYIFFNILTLLLGCYKNTIKKTRTFMSINSIIITSYKSFKKIDRKINFRCKFNVYY